ncbi:hypothetical protein ANN_20636 [Periplaneta americana]|uniref:Uncharacterized protein n=1 Tax=Periplaneta americana TaxID=6978 RepID=A0ABQ8SEG6_PERAM|nr:hypothetical protein ANN_20636 [Periplaneta americana]
MEGLCEGGNEPPGFLRAITNEARNIIHLVDKFRATVCTERKKSVRWPTKMTEDAVEDARERMQQSPNKLVKKLAVEIVISYGSAHEILRNKLGEEYNARCDVSANTREKAESDALAGLKVVEIGPAASKNSTAKAEKYCNLATRTIQRIMTGMKDCTEESALSTLGGWGQKRPDYRNANVDDFDRRLINKKDGHRRSSGDSAFAC